MHKDFTKTERIVVIGSSNTDMVIKTAKLPAAGETILGDDLVIVQGGKGANQAVAAKRAGANVTFIARVGNDNFGTNALNDYKADDIDTNHIIIDNSKPTGVALIIVSKLTGQNSIVVSPGANQKLSIADIKDIRSVISSSKILLVQLEISIEVAMQSLKLATENSVKTILNPAPATELSDELLSYVDIITPNETETEILTKITPFDEISMEVAANCLLEKVNEAVIITLGSKGVFYATKSGERGLIPANLVKAVDTTAAGDVFNGYLAAMLAKGMNMHEAIVIANQAAAISVTRNGAQPSIPVFEELNLAPADK